jgi:hypothetical protein
MPDKTEKAASTKVIKWTEEEWASVANHLFAQKGPALLSSPGLEEIRAKDVFLAQEALSEDRHRKLISIAQGFQGIRHRLAAIFEGMNEARQNDLFKRDRLEAGVGTQAGNGGEAAEARPEQAAVASSESEREVVAAPQPEQEMKKPAREKKPHLPEATDSSAHTLLSPAAQAESSSPAAAPEAAQPAPAAPVNPGYEKPAGRREDTAEQPPRRHEQAARERQRTQEPRLAAEQSAQVAFQPPSIQAAASFIEAARPFVAMVCDELAMA